MKYNYEVNFRVNDIVHSESFPAGSWADALCLLYKKYDQRKTTITIIGWRINGRNLEVGEDVQMELELDAVLILKSPWNWDEKTVSWAEKTIKMSESIEPPDELEIREDV